MVYNKQISVYIDNIRISVIIEMGNKVNDCCGDRNPKSHNDS